MKCPLTGLPLDSGLSPMPTAIPPLWRLGFRPFFLGGAAFALCAIGLWIFVYADGGALAWEPLGGWLGWHRHEMPFGFALAIVAGFLLTAVQN
ncbi:MAG: NnrS family protein, partial [Zoogloeaceae bacterium]|nr:NnrS family protein [Zoogloeaceae bacterium]